MGKFITLFSTLQKVTDLYSSITCRFTYVPFEPEVKTLSFGMEKDHELVTEEPENDAASDEDEEEDDDDGSDSDGEDSFSDLASSNDDADEEPGLVETKPKSVKVKGEGLNKGEKTGEMPFVFKGSFFLLCSLIF